MLATPGELGVLTGRGALRSSEWSGDKLITANWASLPNTLTQQCPSPQPPLSPPSPQPKGSMAASGTGTWQQAVMAACRTAPPACFQPPLCAWQQAAPTDRHLVSQHRCLETKGNGMETQRVSPCHYLALVRCDPQADSLAGRDGHVSMRRWCHAGGLLNWDRCLWPGRLGLDHSVSSFVLWFPRL